MIAIISGVCCVHLTLQNVSRPRRSDGISYFEEKDGKWHMDLSWLQDVHLKVKPRWCCGLNEILARFSFSYYGALITLCPAGKENCSCLWLRDRICHLEAWCILRLITVLFILK